MKDNLDFNSKVSLFSNEKLCEIIVSFRYIGLMKDESILCMVELAKRRENGDNFNFEKYIEEQFEQLPKIKYDIHAIPDLSKLKDIL